MKISKFFVTGLAAIALAGVAHADATINITGSTAFRSAVNTSILATMTGVTYGYTGLDFASASQAIFKGSVAGISGVTTVRTSWSGSATGVQSVASGNNVNFLPTSTTVSGGGTSGAATGTDAAPAHLAMSDVYQSSTIFTSPTLVNTDVAVVPFAFVANDGAPAGLTNVTSQLFRSLYANGALPLSNFTGNPSDTITVYPTGRDTGSGTRISTLAEMGYGIFTLVNQWKAAISGVNGSVTSLQYWPTSGAGADVVAGNGGYSSGGLVRDLLGCTSTNVTLLDEDGNTISTGENLLILGYIGVADVNTAVTNGGKELSYNGVFYSVQKVQQGAYTFWGYEHLYSTSSLTADETTFKNALANQIPNNLGAAGIDKSTMLVSRSNDGGLVGPL